MPLENKMMKGFHGMINRELLDFLRGAFQDLDEMYPAEVDPETGEDLEVDPDAVIKALMNERGWIHENDKFGNKAYKTTSFPASNPPLPTDEFRVTVVNPRGKRAGALYVDIRPWGQY